MVATSLLACVALSGVATAQERTREIPLYGGDREYKVAVQRFAPDEVSGAAVEPVYAELTAGIEFAEAFDVMDPGAFLEPTQTTDFERDTIPCDNWRASGAAILVQGQIESAGSGRVRLRYRIWDVVLCKQSGSVSSYTGEVSDIWKLARRVADDVVFRFEGYRGVASTQIAFISNRTGNKEVYVMEAVDGARKTRVTSNGQINLFPAWSQDAMRLLYTSYRSNLPDLWMLGRGEIKQGLLLGTPMEKDEARYRAVWGPEPGKVTVVIDKDRNTDIYIAERNGKVLERLTTSRSIDIAPSWSPDGRRMVFTSDRSGSPQLYLYERSDGSIRRLTFRGRYNANPAWSPTDNYIVYQARTGLQNFDLYIMDPDSGDTFPLMLHQRVDQDPVWSPNGRKVAFSSDRRGRLDIYAIDANGKNLTRLTAEYGACSNPTWATWID